MKKLFTLIGVAALLATVSLKAQVPTVAADGRFTLPLTFSAGTTNYPPSVAPITGLLKQQNIAFESIIEAGTSGATNQYIFAPVLQPLGNANPGLWDTATADELIFSNAITGAGTNVVIKTFSIGGNIQYALVSVVTTGTVTNGIISNSIPSLSYATKISSP